ncbi:MAG: hypothetical protein H0W83_05485 [Planctomycetes bacterium]|nr:hypothetical protein [Planctomycetota bacterium]
MARPRKRPATELSEFLDAALQRKRMSHNRFSTLVHMKPSSLSDLKLRKIDRSTDRKTSREWAEVLDLSRAEEDDLFELLQLAHSPVYVQELVERIRPKKTVLRVAHTKSDYEK